MSQQVTSCKGSAASCKGSASVASTPSLLPWGLLVTEFVYFCFTFETQPHLGIAHLVAGFDDTIWLWAKENRHATTFTPNREVILKSKGTLCSERY